MIIAGTQLCVIAKYGEIGGSFLELQQQQQKIVHQKYLKIELPYDPESYFWVYILT